jgi:hypothetical protein
MHNPLIAWRTRFHTPFITLILQTRAILCLYRNSSFTNITSIVCSFYYQYHSVLCVHSVSSFPTEHLNIIISHLVFIFLGLLNDLNDRMTSLQRQQ